MEDESYFDNYGDEDEDNDYMNNNYGLGMMNSIDFRSRPKIPMPD